MSRFVCYFHELSEDDFIRLCVGQMNYDDLREVFPQPTWCEYPGATEGFVGCWSLMAHMVCDEDYCRNCDMSKTKECHCNNNDGHEYFYCCIHGFVNRKKDAFAGTSACYRPPYSDSGD